LHDAAGASYADVQQALAQLESDLDKVLSAAPSPAAAPSGAGEEEVAAAPEEFPDALRQRVPRDQQRQIAARNLAQRPPFRPAGIARGTVVRGGKRKVGKKSRKGKGKGKKAKKTQRGGYRALYRNTRRRSTRRSTSSN